MPDICHKFLSGSAFTTVGDRQIRAVCSNEQVDRVGDIVVQAGIQLQNFRKNPIILFGHDPLQPVGKAVSVQVTGGQLEALIEFAPAGASQKADEVCALAKAGVLSTVSIGFDTIKSAPIDPGRPRGPQKLLQIELLEISLVAVPALPSAVVVERQLGGGSSGEKSKKERRLRMARYFALTAATAEQIAELEKLDRIARAKSFERTGKR
jgi:HK97 family phage prohead protease